MGTVSSLFLHLLHAVKGSIVQTRGASLVLLDVPVVPVLRFVLVVLSARMSPGEKPASLSVEMESLFLEFSTVMMPTLAILTVVHRYVMSRRTTLAPHSPQYVKIHQ